MERREFIQDAASFSALMALAGCASANHRVAAEGGPMFGFALPPMKEVRFGFIGLNRGGAGIKPFSFIPGTRVTALCDVNPERIQKRQKELEKYGRPRAKEYTGSEDAWKRMADDPEVDFVIVGTPWHLHTPMAAYMMEHGKHVGVEVPAAVTVEECWQLVETSERTRCVCMQLENRCYNELEMMMFNAIRQGELGEVVYAESGYIHEIRNIVMPQQFPDGTFTPWGGSDLRLPVKGNLVDGLGWRGQYYKKHCGNSYPTHSVGPISQILGINRGDAYDFITCAETGSFALREYAEAIFGKDSPEARASTLKTGDHHVGLIRTKRGKLIALSHNVLTPISGSRLKLIEGTKGAFMRQASLVEMERFPDGTHHVDEGFRHSLEATPFHRHSLWCSKKCAEDYAKAHAHPLWRAAGDLAHKLGGHGGMDFMMFTRMAYCLNRGLPLDQDVYDLAAWSSIVELSEKSVLARGRSMDFPDFTRGGWKNRQPLSIGSIDGDYLADISRESKRLDAPAA